MSNVKEIGSKKRKQLSLPVTRSLMGSFSRINSVKKLKNSLPHEDSSMRRRLSSCSVKDLRLKRVFSSSSTDLGMIPNCFDDTENLVKSQIGDFKRMDLSNEDFTQSTPPDPEIFRAEPVVERKEMNSSMKSVLKPCSREKLFKTPGSFSYKRLLPFLMDIDKDRSGKPLIAASVESFTLKDNELQASRDDQNLSCSQNDSSSTIENSCLNEENLAANRTLTDNSEVAKTNVEYPCNARSLEVLDQTLSSLNDKSESCDYEVTGSSKDETKKSEIQGMLKATVSHTFESQHLNSEEPALSEMGGNSECSLQQRVDIDEDMDRVENLNGECMFRTPPDSNMFSKCEVGDGRGNSADYISQGIRQVIQEPTNETSRRNNGPGHDKNPDLSPKNKMVLQPCSREKLFKTPGSFSYKRLLPFLMDIDKDRSGKPLIAASVESFTLKDNELQASHDDQNLNCSQNDSSSTVENSCLNEENLAVNRTLTDNIEVAKTNVEYPCNARSLEVLDQTLSTLNDKSESCDYEVTGSSKDDTKNSEIQGMQKATVSHFFESQHLNSVEPAVSEMGGNSQCSLQQRVDNDEDMERVENLNGECMFRTPPDSNMFSKCEVGDGRGNSADYISQGIRQVIQEPTNETSHRNNGPGHDKNPDLSPKNKMVPSPHSHLKLTKIPGSFSYRRLLPYLMDITSLNSDSGNNQSLKVEKSSKRKLLSPFFTSSKDTCTKTFNDKSHPVEYHTGDDIELPVVGATSTSSSNHKLTLSPPKQEAESRPKDVVESPDMSSSSPSKECSKFVAYRLPLETDEDCIKSTEKCANHERKIEAGSFVEASLPPEISSASIRKGILKRNPRGCRGICTCLNCTSFRLHAERSFEFSRNQMQDAEEVALDLMKELSYLRNMLEKSAFVAKDQTTICIEQAKEAIKKASDTEELAKTRLNKMNYDLNIHCRIPCGQRPSVRFADYVQEHVIRPIED